MQTRDVLWLLFGVLLGLGGGLAWWIRSDVLKQGRVIPPGNLPDQTADAYRLGYDHGLRQVHERRKRAHRLDD